MTRTFAGSLLALLLTALQPLRAQAPLTYTVEISLKALDEFQVTLEVPAGERLPAVYQFAATAPGTYQVMDMGRFVRSFEAFDQDGKKLKVKKAGTNQWRLKKPEKVRQIRYTIAETWDTPVKEHEVYRMCGTSLEADHALLNGQAIFGFPQGLQDWALRIRLEYPEAWSVGTALLQDADGFYLARSYDHVVDSPFLLGRLTEAGTAVGETKVALYCYSKTGLVQAQDLLAHMQDMLQAANRFLVQLPVDRYTFLFHFEDQDRGAWEHSYSSEYVLQERPLTEEVADGIVSIAAHEFFHIVTPLNLHSEVIERFNFVRPTGSQHLWLYEGVTEWASDMMQLRSGLISLEEYLDQLQEKVSYDHSVDSTYSLARLGINSFSNEGQRQYNNIYNRGAVVAALLDLRLLQLSNGKRGLREVLLELTRSYGPSRPFSEQDFLREFEQLTYPEIGDFFKRYVLNAEPLPLKEYFALIGVDYLPAVRTGDTRLTLGTAFELQAGKVYFDQVSAQTRQCGIAEGDELLAYAGQPVTPESLPQLLAGIRGGKPGEVLSLTIRHQGKEQQVQCRLQEVEEVKRFVFRPAAQATPAQLRLREAWIRNL